MQGNMLLQRIWKFLSDMYGDIPVTCHTFEEYYHIARHTSGIAHSTQARTVDVSCLSLLGSRRTVSRNCGTAGRTAMDCSGIRNNHGADTYHRNRLLAVDDNAFVSNMTPTVSALSRLSVNRAITWKRKWFLRYIERKSVPNLK